MTSVLVWVQHLLGTGHVERMRWVAEALVARGARVAFVTGGMPLPARMPRGATIVQLPPVRATDATFSALVDAGGRPLDDGLRVRRAAALLAAFERARPDVVLLETYPFGRRPLRHEVESLLARAAAASPRPRIVASVRDLLHRRDDPARDAEIWRIARRWVDAVLVHGDAAFARLEDTFAPAADAALPILYTGYVRAPGAPVRPAAERRGIVVSASGGDSGEAMLRTAIAARGFAATAAEPWRVLVGPGVPDERYAALSSQGAEAGIVVERHRDDFAALLAGARVAVTQAGYNTVLDVLVARTPSVLVPFEAGGETEQRMRAERLAALGRAEVVAERELTPATLASAIGRAAAAGTMPPCPVDVGGADRSAECILELARQPAAAPTRGAHATRTNGGRR